jgi:ABC-type glutathione transport system ATPase component
MCSIEIMYKGGYETNVHDLSTVRVTPDQLLLFRHGKLVQEIDLEEVEEFQVEREPKYQ